VTDVSMPGLTGLDVLARLKAERVDSKIVILTMHHDADVATPAIRGGASGFLLKESAGDELVAAIRQACLGTYIPAFEARVPFLMEYRSEERTATSVDREGPRACVSNWRPISTERGKLDTCRRCHQVFPGESRLLICGAGSKRLEHSSGGNRRPARVGQPPMPLRQRHGSMTCCRPRRSVAR
jgi:hypothetical protein